MQTQEIVLKQHAVIHCHAYNVFKSFSERYYEEQDESISTTR